MKNLTLLKRLLPLTLSAALLLTGCGGDTTSKPTETPVQETQGAEQYDYSKYNAYLDLNNEISDIEDILDVYFSNVDYTEDFALLEGGDYAAIKEVASNYTPLTFVVREALDYVEDDPAYPDTDKLVEQLGTSVEEVMDALNSIGAYVRFDEFQEDNLAKAAQLHAELWAALETYDLYYADFMDAMSVLSDDLDQQYLEQLWEQGDLVLYYSECMMNSAQAALEEVMDQINTAFENGAEELPELEMAAFNDHFNQFKEHCQTLKTTLENDEEREKVPSLTGTRGDSILTLYTQKVDALNYYMTQLSEYANGNVDYLEALYNAMDAHDAMIDAYNNII